MSEIETEKSVEGSRPELSTEAMKKEHEEPKNEITDKDQENNEPAAKKAKMAKDNTMVETAKVAKDYLGKEKLDELRSTTRIIRDSKASMKRLSTMAKTAKEGEALLKELGHKDESPGIERRRTRSQTRGTPAPQKSTSQETPKRSRRGRPRKDDKVEDEDPQEMEVRSDDINSAEEEKEEEEEEEEEEETANVEAPEETQPEETEDEPTEVKDD